MKYRGRESRLANGFTLIEMLVVLMLVTVALGMGSAALITILQVQRASANGLERGRSRWQLADRFRADVAGAKDAPARQGALVASPTCLLLLRPGQPALAYRWLRGSLERAEVAGTMYWEKIPTAGWTGAEFVRSQAEPRLLRLRLGRQGADGSLAVFEIAAALGGDLR